MVKGNAGRIAHDNGNKYFDRLTTLPRNFDIQQQQQQQQKSQQLLLLEKQHMLLNSSSKLKYNVTLLNKSNTCQVHHKPKQLQEHELLYLDDKQQQQQHQHQQNVCRDATTSLNMRHLKLYNQHSQHFHRNQLKVFNMPQHQRMELFSPPLPPETIKAKNNLSKSNDDVVLNQSLSPRKLNITINNSTVEGAKSTATTTPLKSNA